MYKEIPTDLECFASPLNATMDKFLSLYPDIDAPFGSQGTFFTYAFPPGNYTANPPYTDIIMSAMYARIATLLDKDEPYAFRIVVPDWSGPPVSLIKQDPRKRLEVFLSSGQHKYVLGSQHVEVQKVIFAIDTYIAFLQNDAGAAKWPLAPDTAQKVKEIFSS
jgi:phosphorylated CTD-interacting factor 1